MVKDQVHKVGVLLGYKRLNGQSMIFSSIIISFTKFNLKYCKVGFTKPFPKIVEIKKKSYFEELM